MLAITFLDTLGPLFDHTFGDDRDVVVQEIQISWARWPRFVYMIWSWIVFPRLKISVT